MLLPHIVEFNANINKHSKSQKEYLPAVKRYANSHILGLSNYNKVMSVRSLVNWIQFMQKEMNIPLTIREIRTISQMNILVQLTNGKPCSCRRLHNCESKSS